MLENGMLVDAERHDIQQREPKSVKCIRCKDMVPEYECHEFFEGWVCGDCLHDYCEEQREEFQELEESDYNAEIL